MKKMFIITIIIVIFAFTGCGIVEHVVDNMVDNVVQEEVQNDIENKIYVPNDKLSDDIRSFQVQINDDIYKFPMNYEEFIEKGWSIDGRFNSEEDLIESYCHEIVWYDLDENNRAYFFIYNPDVSIQPINKCVVSGVSLDCRNTMKTATVFVPKGLRLGEATFNEVKLAFDNPDVINELESGAVIYEYDSENIWSDVSMWFENDILVEYTIENPVATEDFNYSELVDIDMIYVAPDKIGDSIEDRIVNFGGDLYRLPAPVSAFMKNGWIPEDESIVVSADGLAHINLKRNHDGKDVRFTVYNYSDNACTVEDAFVEELSSNDIYGEEFAVSDEIDMNSCEEEVRKYLDDGCYDYVFEETQYSRNYIIKLIGVEWNDYCYITFDSDKDKLSYITITSSNVKMKQ